MLQLSINALIAGSLAALIAAGLALVYGVLGVFNLALGQLALIGGYMTWWFHVQFGVPLLPAVLLGILTGGLVSWASFEIAVGPFYRQHRFLPLVTTIALSMVLDGAMLLLFEERPRSILSGEKHMLHIGTADVSAENVILVAVTLLLLCSIAWLLYKTKTGRQIRATVQHSEAARSLGIRSALLHRILFIGSGMLAGLGGVYLGIDQNITPVLGFSITIKAYAALIAGGKDSLWGTILCAYMIALLEQLAIGLPWWGGQYIPAGYQAVVALAVIICVLIVKPDGLFSRRIRLA